MVRRTKSTSSLKSLSIADLQALLEKKLTQERRKLPALQAKRNKLASKLDAIDSEIAAIGGAAPAKRRGRKAGRRGRGAKGAIRATRGGKMTIPAAIQQVLEEAGKPMKSVDIKNAILQKKLIKKVKKSFAAQVNIALGRNFKKKGRGVYSL